MREPRIFTQDFYYHLIAKGNNQDIFVHKWDFDSFLRNLSKYSKKFLVKILAFVLMPNHVHLLVKQTSVASLSKFMQVLTTSYANYFNLRYKRSGHLFQGRFKHVPVDTDEYLLHLSRYIHLNPTNSALVKRPENYVWSSFRCYLGLDKLDFIDKKTILDYFGKKGPVKDYQEFVDSRIDYQREINLQKLLLE